MAPQHRWFSLLTGVSCMFLFAACSDDGGSVSTSDEATETSAGDGDGDDTDTDDSESAEVGTDTDSGDGDGDPATTETDTDETDTDETETDETDTDETDTDETDTEETDTDAMPECGNGVVEDGEACDDGVNDGEYGGCSADCSALGPYCGDAEVNGPEICDDGVNDNSYGGCAEDCSALAPYCGDAEVNGDEVCDDGVNDGSYEGCAEGCAELGEYCGDGVLNGPETCDDANDDSADGCLGSCEVPGSCLDIINYDDASGDGPYIIDPEGNEGDAFEVHCDMTTDGGGYTFLKISPQNQQSYAVDAEADCATRGMQLWIPRTEEHVLSGWAISNDDAIGPDASPTYMRILGIYPDQNGATCNLQPMNSDNENCNWGSSDGEAWWVHERNNINEPNGDNTTEGSMFYGWNMDGTLNHHNDIVGAGGLGYNTNRYICDVGDKF